MLETLETFSLALLALALTLGFYIVKAVWIRVRSKLHVIAARVEYAAKRFFAGANQ